MLNSIRIVFLDFDGVLVTPASSFRRPQTGSAADPNAIEALNHLLARSGAYLFITSAWRPDYSRDELADLVRSWGIVSEVTGVTPSAATRGEEIQIWLNEYRGHPIGAFVILTDMKDMGDLSASLIGTDSEVGLTMSEARLALKVLTTPLKTQPKNGGPPRVAQGSKKRNRKPAEQARLDWLESQSVG